MTKAETIVCIYQYKSLHTDQIDMSTNYHYAVGRRKAATARAKILPKGKLQITVNKKPVDTYFLDYYQQNIKNLFTQLGISDVNVDLFINGGGIMSQSEAATLAIAKALVKMDEAYRPLLRMHGYLSTDIRKVLPKRPGLRKARKARQWVKR